MGYFLQRFSIKGSAWIGEAIEASNYSQHELFGSDPYRPEDSGYKIYGTFLNYLTSIQKITDLKTS
jgi:hypothetical protein